MGLLQKYGGRGRMPFFVIFCIVSAMSGATNAADPASAVRQSDVCKDDGASLQCGAGQVIHVHNVRCADGSHDCAPDILRTLYRLCQGQGSCSRLGLRSVFGVHCRSPVPRARSLVVKFTCQHVTGSTPEPACRANLCSNSTTLLRCPENSVLHVHNLTCQSGLDLCSPATFLTLYSLCEGRRECDASGLRTLSPLSMYCGEEQVSPELRNIFMDYLCVPSTLAHSKCSGHIQTLTEPFGLLMNPGFAGRAPTTGSQCNWILTPDDQSKLVHLMVHMAYSKWSADNCSTHFLQVRYKQCGTGESKTREFCDLRHINSRITSCGPFHVSSWMPSATQQADRFLVSYQMVPKDSDIMTPQGMAECRTPPITPQPPPITTHPNLARNYGPGGPMFDYSDTIRQTDDSHGDQKPEQKLIILYVFFGVVILALVIALVYVLISYRGISRRGHHSGDSSEKAALWRHDDTPLDTFNHNSLADANSNHANTPTPVITRNPHGNHVANSSDSQVVSCTVHAESADKAGGDQHDAGSGSRVSSFLAGKDGEDNELLANINANGTVSPDGSRCSTLPRRWSAGSGGGISTRSSSFKTNGELGNIYEAIDGQQFHSLQRNATGGGGSLYNHNPPNHLHSIDMQQTPLVQPQPPPSPPLPPPPPPIAEDYDGTEDGMSPIDHYTVNNDEYALVRKPKNRNSPRKAPSLVSPTRRHAEPVKSPSRHSNEYTNMVRDGESDSDPTYDSVDFLRDKSGSVVGFRPTSGPYDRDRNSKSEPVSPSSGGTSKHRWDEL